MRERLEFTGRLSLRDHHLTQFLRGLFLSNRHAVGTFTQSLNHSGQRGKIFAMHEIFVKPHGGLGQHL